MGKTTDMSNKLLKLVFNAAGWANIADNTATSPATNLFISLHTADPTASGNQTSNEIAYTSYARVAVARTTGGWTASSSASTSPVANITFTTGTGGSGTAAYWGIGLASSGTGTLLYSGTITPNIVCGNGIQPVLTTGSTVTES